MNGAPARLAATIRKRTRMALATQVVVSIASKILVVLTARQIGLGDSKTATILAAGTAASYLVHRALAARARVRIESDLQRAMVSALLGTDVLVVPEVPFEVAIYESGRHALHLVAEVAPEALASVVAFVAVMPILVDRLAPRFLGITSLALVGLVLVFVLGRAAAIRAQQRLTRESERVHKQLATAIEGRLDVVARGADGPFERRFDDALASFESISDRLGPLLAFLGRVPIVAGAAVLAVAILVDPGSRDVFAATLLSQALLLTSVAPLVLGLPLRAQELARGPTRVEAFLGLVGMVRRDDRAGAKQVDLPAVFEGSDVGFAYEGGPRVIDGLSFRWSPGEVLVVDGPNGAGKSTLLRLFLGLRSPSSGRISVGAISIELLDLQALRSSIAYLPQRPYLGPATTTIAEALHLLEPGVDDARIDASLLRVGLPVLRTKRVGELSGGQRQRVALARVLLHDAPIVLLDEPDASLDVDGVKMLAGLVKELAAEGKMVAIAAHTRELAALEGVRVTLSA